MAEAVIRSGGGMEPEQHQRTEKTSAGLLGVESNRAGAAEDTTQNGGRSEGSSTGEALLVAAVAAEDKVPPNLSITGSSQRRSSISAANEQQKQQQLLPSGVLGGPPPLPKPPEDLPVRRNFQIPRKSREKKGCSFPFPSFSPSLPYSSYSLGRLFMHLTQLHAKSCGCGGGCGMAQTSEAAGDKIFSIRGFYILSASYPTLFFVFILSRGGEKTKPKLSFNFRPLL